MYQWSQRGVCWWLGACIWCQCICIHHIYDDTFSSFHILLFKRYIVVHKYWDYLSHFHYFCKKATLSFHHIHFEIRVLSVSHWMGLAVGVVICILYVLILDKSRQLVSLLKYMHWPWIVHDCNQKPLSCIRILKGWKGIQWQDGCWIQDILFVCWPLGLPDVVKPIAPHTSEGISGWLTCHNPSFSELGQVRKHVAMCCIEVVGLDNHLHQSTLSAHFYTVSHWNGIYLYFYYVKIQIFDYRIITTSWSCLMRLGADWYWLNIKTVLP